MAAMVACSLPTLMFPTLSLYISEVWSSGWCPFPLTVRESWIPLADLEYCDLGIANASVGSQSSVCLSHDPVQPCEGDLEQPKSQLEEVAVRVTQLVKCIFIWFFNTRFRKRDPHCSVSHI